MIPRLNRITLISFFIGLAAGLTVIIISFFLRSYGSIFVPELASQTLFSSVPGEIESQAVESLGPLAKYISYIGAVIVNLIIYGLIGIILSKIYRKLPWKGYLGKIIECSLIAYAIMFIISFILISASEVKVQTISFVSSALFFLPHLLFGFILSSYLYERLVVSAKDVEIKSQDKIDIDNKKRLFLRSSIATAIALPILFYGLNQLIPKQEKQYPTITSSTQLKSKPPQGFENPILSPLLESEITPTELFYRVDINTIVPEVNENSWNLTVKGLVNNEMTVNYEDIKAMPAVEQYATISCVSNKIGSDFISNAKWKGIRLKDLLTKAQIKPNAKFIVFRCDDGYDVGIPLERGMLDGTILAYEINNVPLPAEHGYPLRAIVPDIYGMMNAKWIREIELTDKIYEGFWQRKGWSNKANTKTLSSIVIPGNASIRQRFRNINSSKINANEKFPIAGIAFAGDRGVSKVEVSSDNGSTWKDAIIKDPLSQYSWVLWAIEFNTEEIKKLMVRATDKTGQVQTSEIQKPFPDGATGYHIINIGN
ncbi:MAG: molybdopterin-dependent oxidoreductase [Nitrososphaeraceae archaeon]